MFGKNSSSKESGPNSSMKSGAGGQHNIIAAGTELKGNVTSGSDFRIDGVFEGDLSCQAKVIVGKTGRFLGNLTCANAVIEGFLDGDIKVAGHLAVKSSAKVIGNVRTKDLTVDIGSVFEVSCVMEGGEQNVKKERENKTVTTS